LKKPMLPAPIARLLAFKELNSPAQIGDDTLVPPIVSQPPLIPE